jgi:hypothetical protein
MRLGSLTPEGKPPNGSARWCPDCCRWIDRIELRGRRRCVCGAAVVRQTRGERSLTNELRPGVVAEFEDPRDLALIGRRGNNGAAENPGVNPWNETQDRGGGR